jgi:hypothetical protein
MAKGLFYNLLSIKALLLQRAANFLQWHCTTVAVSLQSSCSSAANRLQYHCREIAAPLQRSHSATAIE